MYGTQARIEYHFFYTNLLYLSAADIRIFFCLLTNEEAKRIMFKVTINQPSASMLVTGLVDAYDLGVDLGKEPRHVLVQATSWQQYETHSSKSLEWQQSLELAQLMGIVPLYHEMPFDQIIGIVVAAKLPTGFADVSPWTYKANDETIYAISQAHVFDKPLSPRTEVTWEHFMRTSEVFPPMPEVYDDNLIVPVNQELFSKAIEGYFIDLPLTDGIFHLLTNKEDSFSKFGGVVLKCGNIAKRFVYEDDNDFVLAYDEHGNPKRFFSVNKGKMDVKPSFRIFLNTRII